MGSGADTPVILKHVKVCEPADLSGILRWLDGLLLCVGGAVQEGTASQRRSASSEADGAPRTACLQTPHDLNPRDM